jgi:hypothetical protein
VQGKAKDGGGWPPNSRREVPAQAAMRGVTGGKMDQYHDDAKCGSCGGPLDCHRDAVCEKCVPQSQFFEDAAAVQVMTGGKIMKRELHEVWKHETPYGRMRWCLQAPRGVLAFKTKREAMMFGDAARRAEVSAVLNNHKGKVDQANGGGGDARR